MYIHTYAHHMYVHMQIGKAILRARKLEVPRIRTGKSVQFFCEQCDQIGRNFAIWGKVPHLG
jgi:hypothetical protein